MPVEDGNWEDHLEDEELLDPPADEADLRAQFAQGPVSVEQSSAQEPTEPHQATETEESPEAEHDEDAGEDLPAFDPRVKEDFEGLLYLGKLTDEFTWLGHRFVIQTVDSGKLLELALLHKQYANTLADVKAYQMLMVAASLVTVDGQSLPVPLSSREDDTELINAFNYVRKYHTPIIDHLYEKIILLEKRVDAVIEAMGKVPG